MKTKERDGHANGKNKVWMAEVSGSNPCLFVPDFKLNIFQTFALKNLRFFAFEKVVRKTKFFCQTQSQR
jgi:hypothetical protein